MDNAYKGLLTIPVLIILLGTYILLSGEATLKKGYSNEGISPAQTIAGRRENLKKMPIPAVDPLDHFKSNRDSAFQYLLLGTGLLVVLLVLPKLREVSFSPTNGFSLKIINEVKEAIDEVKATTQVVEAKAKNAFNANAPETLLPSPPPDLSKEIRKLEENTAKLSAYATVLEKIIENKGKKG